MCIADRLRYGFSPCSVVRKQLELRDRGLPRDNYRVICDCSYTCVINTTNRQKVSVPSEGLEDVLGFVPFFRFLCWRQQCF